MPKHPQESANAFEETKREKTTRAMKDYQLGFADTISVHTKPVLRNIAQVSRNPSLVSELSKGLGDTSENSLEEEMNAETISIDIQKQTRQDIQKLVKREETSPEAETAQDNHLSSIDIQTQPSTLKVPSVPSLPPTEEAEKPQYTPHSTLPDQEMSLKTQSCVSFQDTNLENNDTILDPSHQRYSSKEINIGSVVADRYEILSKISEGGYGVVYRARQIGVDRVVALKRLRSQNDESVNQRFLLETNIIKALIHPNTIQLIDAGVYDDHLYIVMEYIEGQSLRDLIREEKTLPPERAIHIVKQILKSLHEAHERGIIHRDVKPSNIIIRNIIGEKDFIKLLDFGIAKARFQNMPCLTQDGKILGTPQYLAPELLFGDSPTPAVDIFAVGLILVEMLTGTAPMPKAPKELLKIATSKEPIPVPSDILSSDLGPIIQHALNKDPHKRYIHASDMLADLERVELKYNLVNQQYAVPSPKHAPRKKSLMPYYIFIAACLLIIANILAIYFLR